MCAVISLGSTKDRRIIAFSARMRRRRPFERRRVSINRTHLIRSGAWREAVKTKSSLLSPGIGRRGALSFRPREVALFHEHDQAAASVRLRKYLVRPRGIVREVLLECLHHLPVLSGRKFLWAALLQEVRLHTFAVVNLIWTEKRPA